MNAGDTALKQKSIYIKSIAARFEAEQNGACRDQMRTSIKSSSDDAALFRRLTNVLV